MAICNAYLPYLSAFFFVSWNWSSLLIIISFIGGPSRRHRLGCMTKSRPNQKISYLGICRQQSSAAY